MPTLQFEQTLRAEGYTRVAGIDEAGRGPLAGPVVAAAVVLPTGFRHKRLDDSKKLPARLREEIYEELTQCDDISWSISVQAAEVIDEINILRATHRAMAEAYLGLMPSAEIGLIDGLAVKGFPGPQKALVRGDSLSLSIAAASVIAKVSRDRMMLSAADKYPEYGFERHKGYGTVYHMNALKRYGPCPLHRRSFAPVSRVLGGSEGVQP
jgi:ribonuclease HII